MSLNWILALVALAIWGISYAWYFIGLNQVRPTLKKWVLAILPRRAGPPK